jgi:hypothetical protein
MSFVHTFTSNIHVRINKTRLILHVRFSKVLRYLELITTNTILLFVQRFFRGCAALPLHRVTVHDRF